MCFFNTDKHTIRKVTQNVCKVVWAINFHGLWWSFKIFQQKRYFKLADHEMIKLHVFIRNSKILAI